MNPLQNFKSAGGLLIPVVVLATMVGCSTSRQQPSPENSNAAAVTPAAQPTIAEAAKPRHVAKHGTESVEVSSNSGSAAILNQIHQADQKEIALANMAAGKASSAEVQNYAKQLVDDHTSADHEVLAMAQTMNLHLRDTSSKEGRHGNVKLNSATGPQFDREFLQQTSADHDKLIRELKQEREDTSNDDIEALIDKILPILEQHQQLAQILLKKEQA
jgi:putative membrane protein